MTVAVLQDGPSLWTSVLGQLPGMAIGTALGVAGTLFVDSIRANRRKQRAARSLTSDVQPPLDRLTTALDRFDQARRANPQALSFYFDQQDSVFTEGDDHGLAEAKAAADVLPQECLDSWGQALEEARRLSRMHKSMRSLVGRPNAAQNLSQRAGGYRDQLQDTVSAFRAALEQTRSHSAQDTRDVISDLLRGM